MLSFFQQMIDGQDDQLVLVDFELFEFVFQFLELLELLFVGFPVLGKRLQLGDFGFDFFGFAVYLGFEVDRFKDVQD